MKRNERERERERGRENESESENGGDSLRSRASTMRVSPKSSEFAALELDVGSYPCIGAGPRALESPPPSKMSARCLPDDRIYKHVSQYKLHHAPHPAQEGEPREKTGEQDGTKKPKGEQRGKTGGTGEGRQGEPREKTGERDRTKERKPHPPPTHPPRKHQKTKDRSVRADGRRHRGGCGRS